MPRACDTRRAGRYARPLAAWAGVLLLVAFTPSPGQASRPPWARADTLQAHFPHLLLSVAEARAKEGVQWLDARPAGDFQRGHLPRAISVDPDDLPWRPDSLAPTLAARGVRDDRPLICYSDGPHAAAAGTLLWLLECAGARRVFVLHGGLEAWLAAGGTVESSAPPASPGRFEAAPDTSRWADAAYVRAVAGRPGHEILESRSEAEWEAGHIPHALAFPGDSLWGHSLGLRDGESLRALFAQFGPRPLDPIYLGDEMVVCMRGGPSSVPSLYLALREAGLGRVRGYAGGFENWRQDPTAPIVRIVTAEEVRARMGGKNWWDRLLGRKPPNLLLFDLRSQRDFEVGHLPGAIGLPSHLFADEFEPFLAEHYPDLDRAEATLIFYCYGPTCIRSRHCSSIAAQHGFRRLLWFRDGIEGWYALGERLVRE